MMILASRSMFLRSRNPMVQFVLTYDLDQGHDLYKIIFWDHISVTSGQNVAKF